MIFKKLVFASLMATVSAAAQASTLYDFTYTDTIGTSSIAGVNAGDAVTIHLYGDNGGSSIDNQSFSASNMQGFTVNVGSFHGTYSAVWASSFSLNTNATGAVSSIQFYGTDPTSVNNDSVAGNFTGDYVFGNANFTDPTGNLFTLADSTFNTVSQWTVSPTSAVPEPSSLALLGVAGLGLVASRRRKIA